MKRIFAFLIFIMAMAIGHHVQAQDQRRSFRYYPDANAYYNNQTHQYAYQENGNWVYRRNLPSDTRYNRRSYVTVYGDQDDIWSHNQEHRDKYKDWNNNHKRRHRDRDRDDRDRDERH